MGPDFWNRGLDWSGVISVVVDGDDPEEAGTEVRCRGGGDDRAGGAARAVDGGGSRRALRDSPEPKLRLEETDARGSRP